MKNDTAGNKIEEIIPNCNCGLTGGCKKCNPNFYSFTSYPFDYIYEKSHDNQNFEMTPIQRRRYYKEIGLLT